MQNPLFQRDAQPTAARTQTLTVSALNRLARNTLEGTLPLLRVSGELSNLVRAPSGHFYFTLKDDAAQVRCVMWRSRASRLTTRLDNGMQVEVRALVTLYEVRGDFQLNIQDIRQAGTGNLYENFLRLRDKLGHEGLFDVEKKRALPRYPKTVGVVTSPTAAAFQDVLAALQRRAPCIHVVLYPAQVQGVPAPASLRQALNTASDRATRDGLDAILLVRGGGSLEDLWAFNDESLARAIRATACPVISGVGHETDVTIADFAADVRATTPTMAAELISAGYFEAAARLTVLQQSLKDTLDNRLQHAAQRLDRAALQLIHPRERLQRSVEQLSQLQQRLEMSMTRALEYARHRISTGHSRLRAHRPDIDGLRMQFEHLAQRLERISGTLVPERRERLGNLAAHLEHLSPVATLTRGFSITRDTQERIIRSRGQVSPGQAISVELSDGRIQARVENKS